MKLDVEVLGPVRVRRDGAEVDLGGLRHREVLGRLVAARGRTVPMATLIADLWPERAPDNAVGAVRTFIAALRRALEPERRPRTAPHVVVTHGTGYALALSRQFVDAARLQDRVDRARSAQPEQVLDLLEADWPGEPYADLPDRQWVLAERRRLTELRLQSVELRADALIELGRPASAIADLDTVVSTHPWRERAVALLGLALYRDGRQQEALDVIRRARHRLADELGLDPGEHLAALERDILRQEQPSPYARTGSRTKLRSAVETARTLAIAGGANLQTAQRERVAAVLAAERTGDATLTARTIAAYDVPALWSRPDNPDDARRLVDATGRTLYRLGPDAPRSTRARLLATIGIEHRGSRDAWAADAADEADRIAGELGDPTLRVLALNARFMQSFQKPGAAAERDRIGAEIITISSAHDLPTFEILGHLVRLQARAAIGDFAAADQHATAAEGISESYEAPVVPVLTRWYRIMRDIGTASASESARAYRQAYPALNDAGMPGLSGGLLSLALLTIRLRHGRPAPADPALDWGPYETWILVDTDAVPDPPADHLQELMWCLIAETAIARSDRQLARRARTALECAAGELGGAGSGLITLGPISETLARLHF